MGRCPLLSELWIQLPVVLTNPIGCNVKWLNRDTRWMAAEACDLIPARRWDASLQAGEPRSVFLLVRDAKLPGDVEGSSRDGQHDRQDIGQGDKELVRNRQNA